MRKRALIALLVVACGEPKQPEPRLPYVRQESAAERRMYKPFVPYYYVNPPQLERFIVVLQNRTGLGPFQPSYPVDGPSLRRAAEAFEAAAKEVFGFTLSLQNPDPAQYDVLFNRHLIDPAVQPYFDGARLRELGDAASDEYAKVLEKLRVPRESLFYYCAGAHWGEWLFRHRGARWQLIAPLRPLQSFADMVSAGDTMCIHPFSQVTSKMTDPEGDALAFAADPTLLRKYKPPYPLIATPADAAEAARSVAAGS